MADLTAMMQAAAGAAGGGPANYIEEVFSCFLYTGNGSTQTITNNIDLSTNGGIVWCKGRSAAGYSNVVYDTINGANKRTATNLTNALTTAASSLTAFNTTGFSLGADAGGEVNENAINYVSWSLRKQPKFFDVVTYSGTGSARTVAHSLGSAVGCIFIKAISGTGADSEGWRVYHRSQGATKYAMLQSTNAFATASSVWNDTEPTSTNFTVGTDTGTNGSGLTYIAYLFAHDAGGFGLTGTDNVISCGSYSGTGSTTGFDVTLGYEPQWVLVKRSSGGTGNWTIVDNMRGFAVTAPNKGLTPNTADAEYNLNSTYPIIQPTATGFRIQDTTNADWNASSSTYIYIAIRRGPMKVPTVGTQVYNAVLRTGTGVAATVTGAVFPPDLVILEGRTDPKGTFSDRLRGSTKLLNSYEAAAEATDTLGVTSFSMDGMAVGTGNNANQSGMTYVYWFFRRYPSVFDEVCYVGNDAANTQTHNLKVKPELVISKSRSAATNGSWGIWSAGNGVVNNDISGLTLNSNAAAAYPNFGNSSKFTATTFGADWVLDADGNNKNQTGVTYVTYLFATCAGVSKVGLYNGTGLLQTVPCGFTTGARWVMVKRTDSTGDWYVWDSTRGITAGNDPYLLLNANVAEVTGTNYVDTDTTGFKVTAAAPAGINASGGTYIFLAIA